MSRVLLAVLAAILRKLTTVFLDLLHRRLEARDGAPLRPLHPKQDLVDESLLVAPEPHGIDDARRRVTAQHARATIQRTPAIACIIRSCTARAPNGLTLFIRIEKA